METLFSPMCTTHTSNTKAKSKPTCPSAEDTTEPIKRQAQQGLLTGGGSITPLNNGMEFVVEAAPKAKGKGCQQKMAPSLEGAKDNNEKQAPTNATPWKHGRKPVNDNQSEVEDAPAKWTKLVAQIIDDLPAKPKKGHPCKQPQEITQWAALPDHSGQNVNPAGQPTPRWTSKEVAAECEAQQQVLEEKICEGEQAKLLFARMNVAEEYLDNEMNVDNPQCLSVALCKCGHNDLDVSDNGEHFDFAAIDKANNSEPVQQPKVSSMTLKSFNN